MSKIGWIKASTYGHSTFFKFNLKIKKFKGFFLLSIYRHMKTPKNAKPKKIGNYIVVKLVTLYLVIKKIIIDTS